MHTANLFRLLSWSCNSFPYAKDLRDDDDVTCNTNVKNGTKNGKIAMLPNDLDLITESLQYKCQKMVPKTGKLRRCQVIWTWWQKAYNTNVKKWYQKWENCNVVKWFWLDARKSAIQISQNGIWLFKRTIFCLIFSFSSVIQIINS